ncbi:MAG: radical SAM protein [Candidatus Omnitrophota bacterium]|nr:MAG: radical SAM protein [Candidatus Omnitrophota bacterium]
MKLEYKIKLLEKNLDAFYRRLEKCDICPRECGINRLRQGRGYCGAGKDLVVYTAFLHKGEEPAISGEAGSGTIFFSGCNLKCIYCQNYKFSHSLKGKKITERQLADIMLKLQRRGAHNVNLVTPTHYLPQIMKALLIAFKEGLAVPIVYNSSGYEKKEVIDKCSDIIDIYLMDIKYMVASLSKRYSHAENYPLFNQKVIKTLCNSKSSVWEGRLLKKGLIIRHLVLPGHFEETIRVLSWVKENAPGAILSLMFQYQPYFKAASYPRINRRVNVSEFKQIKDFLEDSELEGWVQDLNSREKLAGPHFKPDFSGLLES